MTKRYHAKPLVLCSFFAALTGVCSIVSIPLPFSPVPVNLALFSVYLAGGLLGPKYGPISQLVYVLLGAIGLPVFHNLTGGLAILVGPTGGFLIGYIAAAFLVGFFYHKRLSTASAASAASPPSTAPFVASTSPPFPTTSASTVSPTAPALPKREGSAKKPGPSKGLMIGMLTGLTACYALGTLWFMYAAGSNLQAALLLCVVPFLPGDAFKIIAAFFLIRKLHPIVNKAY